jgi:uncharacterized membrane protein YkvA (DUF1232 family)
MSKFEDFIKDNAQEADESSIDRVLRSFRKLIGKLHGPLEKLARKVMLFFDMLKDYRDGKYQDIPSFTIGAIVFVLLYVIMPFDCIPDMLPGVGLIDDAIVVATAWAMFSVDIERYEAWRNGERERHNESEKQEQNEE